MKVLVTGGTGFLGFGIAQQLVKQDFEVVTFSRAEKDLMKEGVVHHRGSVSDFTALKTAMQGCEAVFHVAAKTGIWGSYDSFYNTNVMGTENVVRACIELGVPYLVYTSSASVIYQDNSEGKNERIPYPEKFDAPYPKTKAIAEQVVLRANGPKLVTCALRPHLIWGPGDMHFLPRLSARRRKDQLRLLGSKQYLIDTIYIDNAVAAHLQILKKMQKDPERVAGKTYFISQDEPISIGAFTNGLLDAMGLPPVTKTMNADLAMFAGWLFQNVYKLLKIPSEPVLTVFLAKQLSSSHWYDISAAKQDFGFAPVISIVEGMNKLKMWLNENCPHGR
jgi:nucleoside-diphosphate-sugar epimerase